MIPKFRAWHKEKKIMRPVEAIFFDERQIVGAGLVFPATQEEIAEFEWDFGVIELMQWSGLYDGAGKSLYDGDIIELRAKFTDGSSYIDNYEIINEEGCYGVYYPVIDDGSLKEFTPLFYLNKEGGSHFWTAILRGNIYENPELLNPHSP